MKAQSIMTGPELGTTFLYHRLITNPSPLGLRIVAADSELEEYVYETSQADARESLVIGHHRSPFLIIS